MKLTIHQETPESRKIQQLVDILKSDGVLIIPTDSVYAFVCAMDSQIGVDKICRLRHVDPVKANLTFLCESISRISSFTAPIPNEHFRLIKRNTPGPVTFILPSNPSVPKRFKNKKRTIGARIPDHILVHSLMEAFGKPLMSASLKHVDQAFHPSDIDEICGIWEKQVDAIVECGVVRNQETAIIDLTTNDVIVNREGPVEVIL